jgi:hypothetical protein
VILTFQTPDGFKASFGIDPQAVEEMAVLVGEHALAIEPYQRTLQ